MVRRIDSADAPHSRGQVPIGPGLCWSGRRAGSRLLYPPIHRTMTHSLSAVGLVVVATGLIAWRLRRDDVGTQSLCARSPTPHTWVLTGWVPTRSYPAGIQLLWPFSDAWFISSLGVFRGTDFGGFFRIPVMVSNTLAVLQELLILTPISLGAWSLRNRRVRS